MITGLLPGAMPDPMEIQSMFDNGAKIVYIPKNIYGMTEPWRINPGCKVFCEPGSIFIWTYSVKKNAIEFADGVNFEGTGSTFKMNWVGGAFPPDMDDGLLALFGVKNVTITGGIYSNGLIDGIFVGWHKTLHTPCENLLIQNVICDSNRRQGMSIVSAKGMKVYNSTFKNTAGTSPQAGIDIEPEFGCQITDVLIKGCHSQNNASHAYICNMTRLDNTSVPVSVTFENCTGSQIMNGDSVAVVGMSLREKSNPVKGKINFNNTFIWENV